MKKSILIICFVLYSFSVISISGFTNFSGYCALCEGHIACNHTGNLDPNCPRDARVEAFTATERNYLLELHNNYRNQLAGAEIPRFPAASRMMAVVSLLI
jgi:hypothetical protein